MKKENQLHKILSFVFTFSFTFTLALLSSLHTWAISKEMLEMVKFETQSNAISLRKSEKLPIEHFEIPLSLIHSEVAQRIDPRIMNALVFEKNGVKYLRWIINPEDTTLYKEVEIYLSRNDIPLVRKHYFDGYQTASRSYIIVDPVSGVEFSAKVSTDKTGGNWASKSQTFDDSLQIRRVADYVFDAISKGPQLQNIIIADEPAAFGLKDIDHGMVIREYGGLANSNHSYVPGFSIMHEETGRALARINGSDNPATFWNEHYNKPLARALAEFTALSGMTYDSPHSQNFLVELDKNKHPTGKIVLRDFGDTFLISEYFKAIQREDILQRWEKSNILSRIFYVSVGILHGNTAPSWMSTTLDYDSDSSYDKWGRDFYVEFDKEFARQTGVSLSKVEEPKRKSRYYIAKYSAEDSKGEEFLSLVKKGHQRANLKKVEKCDLLFAM